MSQPERTHQRTTQQRAAAESRERDVFLRAGAGTGKTSVLVDRFCEAALDPEMGVERILAFTFTERAADQLRRRVRETLAALAEEAEGERLERIHEAAEAAERAWISTIHGFCRRLLASHPAAAGLDPRFRVADEPEADRLATRAFEVALEDLVTQGGAEALELAAANHKRTLVEMTSGAYDELRSRGQTEPALPEPPVADPAAAIAELIEAAQAAHDECAEANGQAAVNRELIATATELDPAAPPDAELLDKLAALKLETKAKAFAGPECERYRESLQRARAAAAATVLAPAYAQLRELVSGFGRAYEALKADRSALDFEDLQLRARELLRSNERVRDRYREQFRHLMVDEFQDTNGLQLGLIEQLRGPDTRVFMVGDEFQSIYGFRHADIDVYRRQQRRFAGGEEPNGESMPLTGNFRAAPELLAATNALGAALLDGFEPLTAPGGGDGPAGGEPAVEMLLTVDDKKGWEDPTTELPRLPDDPSAAPKVAEARRLAGRLRELVDAGEDPSGIVVLMRAFTHVNTLERSLARAGLDPYVVGGRGFWSQQQIEDLRCLLAVVANPLDDEPLFGALASPACAVLPDTLWLLRRAASEAREDGRERRLHIWPLLRDLAADGEPSRGDPEAAALIPPEETERLSGFVATVNGLRRRGAEDGLEALVERVASAFDYDLATLIRDSGEARWANVRKLMRLAREFEGREGPDLTAFLDYLANRAARSDREAEAATRAEGHAGVRVMTIHSAKGLEFDVVAVADMGRNLQIGWTPLRLAPAEDEPDSGEVSRVGIQLGRLGRPGERMFDYYDLADLAADREAEEEGRLAYVAATRAKKRLLLSGTFNPKALKAEPMRRKPIANQLIRTLLGGEPEERDLELPAAGEGYPAGRLSVKVSAPEPGAGAKLLVEQPAPEATPVAMDDAPPLGRPQVAPAPAGALSYSALSDYEACGYRFYAERVLGIAGGDAALARDGAADEQPTAGPEARRRYGPGLAVHALLEWSSEHRWSEPDAERVAAALREQGLPDDADQVERALELVRGWLSSQLRGELSDARTSPEVPFVLNLAQTPIRGSIDLLADRGEEGTLVVDYKTDRLDGREPEQLAGRYRVQRELYALAAAARGVPVETAYVFLERPDSPVRQTFGQAELDEGRERIEGLLGRLGAGEFGVTHNPHRAICHDCPARERLCSHEPAAQMRDDPDPPIVPVPRSERPKPEGDAEDDADPAPDPEGGEPQLSLLD